MACELTAVPFALKEQHAHAVMRTNAEFEILHKKPPLRDFDPFAGDIIALLCGKVNAGDKGRFDTALFCVYE